MASGTRPKSKSRKPKSDPSAPEQPQQLDGVVIAIDPEAKERGELALHIAAQGNVSLVELPGLLLVAKKQVEEKLGS